MTEEEQIVVKAEKGKEGYYVEKLDISHIPDDDALWDFLDETGARLLSPDWKEGYIVEHNRELWLFFSDWEEIEEEYEEVLVDALKKYGYLIDDEGNVVKLYVVRL
jgi:hypothetical protein